MAIDIKILVVEDNLDLREIIQQFLEAYGFIVVVAKDGQEGLDLYAAEQPHAVLADVLLPRVNGFQICDKIKKGERPVPVVLMSALYKTYNLQKEAKTKYGADEYLIKPLNLMAVAKMLCELIGIDKPQRSAAAGATPAMVEEEGEAPAPAAAESEDRAAPLYELPDEADAADLDLGIDAAAAEALLAVEAPEEYPLSGDFAEVPPELLVGYLYRLGSTGKLTVTAGATARTVYLKLGVPLYVNSNVPAESFAQLLVADGKVTAQQLARVEQTAKERGATVGKLLVETGALSAADLAAYLLREVDYRLGVVLDQRQGKYAYTDDDAWLEKIKRPEMNVFEITYQAVLRNRSADDLRERYEPRADRVVVKNEDQLAPAGQIQWRDDHLEAFMAIDGERTVNEVIAAAAQPAAAVHQLLYTLETFDVIRFR